MKKLIFLALTGIAMFFNSAKAQNNDNTIHDFFSIDKVPQYSGGMKNFYSFIAWEIKYPEVAQKNNTEGKVFLSFIVEKDGSLSDIKVVKGLTKETDEEAVRVLQKSPKWEPGTDRGEPVRVKYNININFSLSSAKQKG